MKFVALATVAVLLVASCFQVSVEAGLLSTLLPPVVTQVNSTFYTLGNYASYKSSNDLARLPTNGDQVGTIALPLNTLCETPGVNTYLTCFICNDDCLYVHNTYGGKCGPHPTKPGNFTCLCADTPEDAAARGISTNTRATCDATGYPPSYADLIDSLLFPILRLRMTLLQCLKTGNIPNPSGYNNTGCTADCVQNHGYAVGDCTTAAPKVPSTKYSAESQQNFCLCGNSTSTTTTTTTTTTTSTTEAPAE